MLSDLLDRYNCLYMLAFFIYVLVVCLGWVEAELLCVIGQHTYGDPDRLQAQSSIPVRPKAQRMVQIG